MKGFVIFALIAVAAARPDIGLQYQQGNFGGSSSGGFSSGSSGFGGGSSGGGFGGSSGGGGFGGSSGGGFGGSSGGGGSGGVSVGVGFGPGGGQDGGVTQGQTQVIDISGGGSASSIVYKPVIRQGPPQISKHFYVHEAPEEAVNVEVREKEIQVRPQKHYKIIFIKAPGGGSAVAGGNAAIFPQSEEKTIVYVLSKKPSGVEGSADFPTPPAPVTTKPEVFFVKYKTAQEAEGAISTIQQSFQEGGQGFNNPAGFAAGLGGSSGSATSSSFGGSSGGSGGFGGNSGGSFGGNSGGSFRSGQGFAGAENIYQSEQMVEIPVDNSAFKSDYLPPQ